MRLLVLGLVVTLLMNENTYVKVKGNKFISCLLQENMSLNISWKTTAPELLSKRYTVTTIKTKTKNSVNYNSSYYTHQPTIGVNMQSQIFVAITVKLSKSKQ